MAEDKNTHDESLDFILQSLQGKKREIARESLLKLAEYFGTHKEWDGKNEIKTVIYAIVVKTVTEIGNKYDHDMLIKFINNKDCQQVMFGMKNMQDYQAFTVVAVNTLKGLIDGTLEFNDIKK